MVILCKYHFDFCIRYMLERVLKIIYYDIAYICSYCSGSVIHNRGYFQLNICRHYTQNFVILVRGFSNVSAWLMFRKIHRGPGALIFLGKWQVKPSIFIHFPLQPGKILKAFWHLAVIIGDGAKHILATHSEYWRS